MVVSSRLHIIEICKNGEKSLGNLHWVYSFVWGLLSVLITLLGFNVAMDYIEVIVGALAIFAGFYFTLIVYVTDKTVQKLHFYHEEEKNGKELSNLFNNYIKNYREFSKQLISQISYSIVIAIALILVTFLTQLEFDFGRLICLISWHQVYLFLITIYFLYLSLKLLHLILLIISNMQAFFSEEMDNTGGDL